MGIEGAGLSINARQTVIVTKPFIKMKFWKTVFFGVLFEVSYSNLVLNDMSYELIDKDKYPAPGILQIFEDVHSPVECGVLVHGAPEYFYNKVLNVCLSTKQGNQSPLLAAPGFYHYRHACETCCKYLQTFKEVGLSPNYPPDLP